MYIGHSFLVHTVFYTYTEKALTYRQITVTQNAVTKIENRTTSTKLQLRNNRPFYRHEGHFGFSCFRYLLWDANFSPRHPIITIWNNRIQNGCRISNKVYYLYTCTNKQFWFDFENVFFTRVFLLIGIRTAWCCTSTFFKFSVWFFLHRE